MILIEISQVIEISLYGLVQHFVSCDRVNMSSLNSANLYQIINVDMVVLTLTLKYTKHVKRPGILPCNTVLLITRTMGGGT